MNDQKDDSTRRYKGILTQHDREFLQTVEWDEQSSLDRDARHRIRQRVIEGLRDFYILSVLLPEKDKRLIFESVISNPDLTSGAIAFYYLGISNLTEFHHERHGDEAFADRVQQAIEMAYRQQGLVAQADVSINTDPEEPDPEELRDTLLSGDGTIAQLNYLIAHDEVEPLLKTISESNEVMAVETPTSPYELTPNTARQILERRRNREDTTPSDS